MMPLHHLDWTAILLGFFIVTGDALAQTYPYPCHLTATERAGFNNKICYYRCGMTGKAVLTVRRYGSCPPTAGGPSSSQDRSGGTSPFGQDLQRGLREGYGAIFGQWL